MNLLPTSLLALMLSASSTPTPAFGERAVAVARTAVLQRGQEAGLVLSVEHVGRIPDVAGPALEKARWSAQLPADHWLRPRLPVAVTMTDVDGRRTRTVTVWLAVSAPTKAAVYAADALRGTPAAQVPVRMGEVDLARTHGERPVVESPEATSGRLRRAVREGEPALASDLEPVPAVTAQQRIAIEAVSGPVRLATLGTALTDGDVGDLIPVRPDHAAQPVKGRVISHEVVRIER